MSTDKYIKIGNMTINVMDEVINTETKEGMDIEFLDRKGYLDSKTGTVWIYQKHKPLVNCHRYPYFWKDKEDFVFSEPEESTLEQANESHIIDRSFDAIVKSTDPDATYNRKIQALINAGSSMTLPVIKRADDFLKKMVKAIIRKKRLSLTALPTTAQAHLTSNMRSALLNDTKMSTTYYTQWSDLTSHDFIHVAFDAGRDPDHPLKTIVVYDSRRDMIGYLPPDRLEGILKSIEGYEDDEWVKALATRQEDDVPTDSVEVISMDPSEEDGTDE